MFFSRQNSVKKEYFSIQEVKEDQHKLRMGVRGAGIRGTGCGARVSRCGMRVSDKSSKMAFGMRRVGEFSCWLSIAGY